MNHREIEANGISLHFVEEGQGPAVIFCHGFPAIWSSWKASGTGRSWKHPMPQTRRCSHFYRASEQ